MIEAIHPGEQVKDEIEAMELTPDAFAEQLGIPAARLQDLLHGEASLDAEMAIRLGHYFKTSAEFWLKLQNLYDLRITEAKFGEAVRQLPVAKHLQAA